MGAQHSFWRFAAVFSILGLSLGASRLLERRASAALARPLSTIPADIAGWNRLEDSLLPEADLAALRPTDYLSRRYVKSGRQIDLFIAYYAQQRAGESMHSPKNCLPGSGWQIWDYGSAGIPVDGRPQAINKYYIQNSGQRAIVLYWYQSNQRIIANEYLGKLLLIRDALATGDTSGSIVRIVTSDQPEAAAEAIRFAAELAPQVQRCFAL